jgi:hypothetical protein
VTPIGGIFGSGGPSRPRAVDEGLREKVPAIRCRAAADAPPQRRRRQIFNASRPEPAPSHQGTVEDPEGGKLGICCSGGGIRSAAFSLGALQALGREGELRRAAYLAAVSGGSYIAAAASMVNKTGPRDSDEDLIEDQPPFAAGSPEEQYLRNRASYLAPTGSDMLYVGIRIVLGLLLNLTLLSLPLIGAALLLTGVVYAPHVPDLAGAACRESKCAANLPPAFWIAPLGLLGAGLLFGLATLLFRWRKEGWERFFTAWSTRLTLAAAAVAVVLVGMPYLVDWLDHLAKSGGSVKPSAIDTISSISAGFLAMLAGVFAQIARLVTSKDAAETTGKARKALGKAGSGIAIGLAYAAGALIGPLLLLGIAGLAVAVGMSEAEGGHPDWALAAIGAGVLLLSAAIYAVVDLTTWSLHPFYKRRLASAFALKRVKEESLDEEERRRVEALVPAEAAGNEGLAIERDFDELVPLSQTALEEKAAEQGWPTLLVCAAANVSDPGATPPGRRVTSFTFSANTAGGPLVGAVKMTQLERAFEHKKEWEATEDLRRSAEPGVRARLEGFREAGARKHRRRDLTLPAAVAMSGAAISPSMGKMTPRALTFLMALANLRLGVWVPNPRWVAEVKEDTALPRKFARARAYYLFKELLGRNRIDARYLYVSDGGHYENLGLVELLRRGCTEVYCLDASGVGGDGAEFKTLGDAIALARSELNVEIEFSGAEGENPEELTPPEEPKPPEDDPLAKRDVVTAAIKYPPGPDGEPGPVGKLVYVRNTMTGKAPWDVRAHHESDPRFPNNPTVDQLYTDQKFEAYRALGAVAGANAHKALQG